jgi:DnaJ-class molecular chaperone
MITAHRFCDVCMGMGAYYPSIILRPGMTAGRKPPTCDICDGQGMIAPDRSGISEVMSDLRARIER